VSQLQFTVRTETYQLQTIGVRLAIDENQVGFDVAVGAPYFPMFCSAVTIWP
jgi:hypothetical protein